MKRFMFVVTFCVTFLGLAFAQDVKELKDITALLSPETIAMLLVPLTMGVTYLAKQFFPAVEGIVTVAVNALANAVTVGAVMLLGGEATLGYIAVYILIKFILDQVTYYWVVKPNKGE